MNATKLQEADMTGLLINRIHKRQVAFLGHVIRRENLEHQEWWNENTARENGKKKDVG